MSLMGDEQQLSVVIWSELPVDEPKHSKPLLQQGLFILSTTSTFA
jgi:hypothetical protein